ncbi:hypothetical protein [Streptomonospora salina]|uniref:Uncharacterized protein n=1 Tax=Streptomonospora salina TaxID=104205 RepID=A0A841E0Z3_9ACTN|nr:hypothetical protein [Streptomonospora salina]MBB5996726.1 hypothetical protein [Streptomonospora salina]
MGIRNNRIERTMRRAMGGRLDGMGGGSPASRTHRPHLKGGAAQARGLGAAVRPNPQNRGGMQRGLRRIENRLRRAIRR